jgi:trk system potassium uptake protein TrkA
MRKIAVIGLSAFGDALVRELSGLRCHVLAVDVDEEKIDAIREIADEALIADARDPRALEGLRLQDFDAVILSLGERIDSSLLAVLHLRDLKVRPILAKAVTEDHRRLLLHLGVDDAIFPEADTAKRTARTLANPGFLDTMQLGEDVSISEVAPTSKMVGKTLADLDLRRGYGINVVAVRDTLRDQTQVNPDPSALITDSDVLIVLGKVEDIDRFVGGK